MITTPRLRIIQPKVSVDNARQFVEWLNDPEVVRFSEQRHKHHNVWSQLEYMRSFVLPHILNEIYLGDQLIGSVTAYVDAKNDVADVGILLGDKTKWGQGLGLEAWRGFCNDLFRRGVRKIEAGCMATNYAMATICTKYGMQLEAQIPAHFLVEEKPVGLWRYGKLKWEHGIGGRDGEAI